LIIGRIGNLLTVRIFTLAAKATGTMRKKILGFNDLKYSPLIILFLGLITPIAFFGVNPVREPIGYLINSTISTLMTVIYYFSVTDLTIRLRVRYPDMQTTPRRLVLQIFWVAVLVSFIQTIVTGFFAYFQIHGEGYSIPTGLQVFLASIFLTFMVLAIFEVIYIFQKYRHAEIEREKLQRMNAKSQLEALKNQVNPHLLFNSLNTLTSLIPEDPTLAVEFVQKLSASYRNILTFRDEKLISLRKELDALDSYIFLLKMRFQDKIIVENQIPEELYEHLIIPLSLQMLIENAVKHNVVSSKKPLFIQLSVKDNSLVVSNNLQIKQQSHNSTKVGLTNIKSRYKLVNDTEVKIIETDEIFQVQLPLIKLSK